MINRCETCTHWDRSSERFNESGHTGSAVALGLGRCTSAVMFFDVTEWREDGDGRRFTDEAQDAAMFIQDGSDYWAVLFTRPDFGCVKHRPRATDPASA